MDKLLREPTQQPRKNKWPFWNTRRKLKTKNGFKEREHSGVFNRLPAHVYNQDFHAKIKTVSFTDKHCVIDVKTTESIHLQV